jgi:3-methylcrotonyl-CoA carboxylase alpha subunit
VRTALHEAAVAFGRAIGYRSAGTVEFVLEDDEFFFLELNGRIQVEHPVTEAVTGLDLIAEQIRIAGGKALAPDGYRSSGHSVEARLYAEDPRTFLPQAGRIERLRLPPTGARERGRALRVDSGVEEGDEVGLAYDPMIAKLVAHGPDREAALDELAAALEEIVVGGVVTNLPFLRWLVEHPVVRAGEATTAFLAEHPPLSALPLRTVARPFRAPWRLNLPAPAPSSPPDVDREARSHGPAHGASTVTAPMPGTVISVDVGAGDDVEARSPLVVLEAMKMEIPVHSPFAGTVTAVHVAPGDRVAGGTLLVELES